MSISKLLLLNSQNLNPKKILPSLPIPIKQQPKLQTKAMLDELNLFPSRLKT